MEDPVVARVAKALDAVWIKHTGLPSGCAFEMAHVAIEAMKDEDGMTAEARAWADAAQYEADR